MAEKIMLVLGILCMGYFVGIAVYVGLSSKFPIIWAAAGLLFFAAAFLMHKKVQIPFGIRSSICVAAGILLAAFVCTEAMIVKAMLQKPDRKLDYIIVLGAQVKGKRPSQSLRYRIEEAQKYLEEHPDTKAVLSGGKGLGEDISEAECMHQELVKAGVDSSRLLKEDKSTSTSENIAFSCEILEKIHSGHTYSLKTGIVTNSFHVFRGAAIAGKKMDGEVQGIPAKSNSFLQMNYLLREFLGVVKDKIAGNL